MEQEPILCSRHANSRALAHSARTEHMHTFGGAHQRATTRINNNSFSYLLVLECRRTCCKHETVPANTNRSVLYIRLGSVLLLVARTHTQRKCHLEIQKPINAKSFLVVSQLELLIFGCSSRTFFHLASAKGSPSMWYCHYFTLSKPLGPYSIHICHHWNLSLDAGAPVRSLWLLTLSISFTHRRMSIYTHRCIKFYDVASFPSNHRSSRLCSEPYIFQVFRSENGGACARSGFLAIWVTYVYSRLWKWLSHKFMFVSWRKTKLWAEQRRHVAAEETACSLQVVGCH